MARPDAHAPMWEQLLLLQEGADTFSHTLAPFPMGCKGGQEGRGSRKDYSLDLAFA